MERYFPNINTMTSVLEQIELQKGIIKSKHSSNKNLQRNSIQFLSANQFKVEQNLSGDGNVDYIIISGIALAEGTAHGLFYSGEEIQKAAEQLVGKDLRVMHKLGTKCGEVLTAKYNNKELLFKAIVSNKDAIKQVMNGSFNAVSVGVKVDVTNKELHGLATDLEFVELSLVEEPACEKARIQSVTVPSSN